MSEKQITQRKGGWFVDYGTGFSGPWETEEAAELARDNRYEEAHAAERAHRNTLSAQR